VPLSHTFEAQIGALRNWARSHARSASPRETQPVPRAGLRQMELT
jgi:hypothetical protein